MGIVNGVHLKNSDLHLRLPPDARPTRARRPKMQARAGCVLAGPPYARA